MAMLPRSDVVRIAIVDDCYLYDKYHSTCDAGRDILRVYEHRDRGTVKPKSLSVLDSIPLQHARLLCTGLTSTTSYGLLALGPRTLVVVTAPPGVPTSHVGPPEHPRGSTWLRP